MVRYTMKILTWNINGIRSVKKELDDLFHSGSYDIVCVQETKVTRDQLSEAAAVIDGYNSYFSFSRGRSGYSGVATFVKDTCVPLKAEEGISGLFVSDNNDVIGSLGDQTEFSAEEIHSLDSEGRTVITQHKIIDEEGNENLVSVVNVYCPRADPENEERKVFKIRFYELLQVRIEAILNSGSHVILLGDLNTSHKKLDHCDPAEDKEFYSNPGRKWLTQLLWDPERNGDLNKVNIKAETTMKHQFVDVFRYFHPHRREAYTCWSTVTGSRATNYGTRIDYIIGDVGIVCKAFADCDILPEMLGSDHCPVWASLDWEIIPSKKYPDMCTKFMPEFLGKQQKLSSFFIKKDQDKNHSRDVSSSQESSDSGVCTESFENTHPDCAGEDESTSTHTIVDQQTGVCSANDLKKRSTSAPSQAKCKKLKTIDKKSSGSKQGNLLSFFIKKPTESKESAPVNTKQVASELETSSEKPAHSDDETSPSTGKLQSNVASASWKSLLKGPPAPPLCKGHQEPCVLRTVKKDSLNKGRQFWVCPRPEGHKSNPEARCDYFVWVSKKKP